MVPASQDESAIVGSPEQIVGEFFRVGMDERLANDQEARPIEPELARIAEIETRGDVMAELARFHRWSINAGFGTRVGTDIHDGSRQLIELGQAGLSLMRRESYVNNDARSLMLRAGLMRCIRKTFSLLGDPSASLDDSSQTVMAVETQLAQAEQSSADGESTERNFHRLSFSDLVEFEHPLVDWSRYFIALGAAKPSDIDVAQPEYIKTFGKLLNQIPISDWRFYLRWKLVSAASPFLSADFVQQSFELLDTMTGQESPVSRQESVLERNRRMSQQ